MNFKNDIMENDVLELSPTILATLLQDHSSKKNIIWATNHYEKYGDFYKKTDEITPSLITGINGTIIQPRTSKNKEQVLDRIKNNAEVFTPSWICNEQNNLIDDQWFEGTSPFNSLIEKDWITNDEIINFKHLEDKTWLDYVKDTRLEITCGEAPYITSRYDSVTGEFIPIERRIGLLDRKLRVICENTDTEEEWIKYAVLAMQNIYAYEFQGDSLLIARENILYAIIESYNYKFKKDLDKNSILEFANIISWNIWQMDGLKYVIPFSCHNEDIIEHTLFGDEITKQECLGCKKNAVTKHNGIYCIIKDWEKNRNNKFVNVVTRGR